MARLPQRGALLAVFVLLLSCAAGQNNIIARENMQTPPDTWNDGWSLNPASPNPKGITGYATKESIKAGDPMGIRCSTP
jgi:hypothetical protein